MPTVAQKRLSALDAWFWKSSRPRQSPMGKTIPRGRYASIVSQNVTAPIAGAFEPEALVIAVSSTLAQGVSLAPTELNAPLDHGWLTDRIDHLLFLAGDGRELPPAAWVGVVDPDQTLAEALAGANVGIGLADTLPTLFVRLYSLPPAGFRALRPRFPFVSTHSDPVLDELPPCGAGSASVRPSLRMQRG